MRMARKSKDSFQMGKNEWPNVVFVDDIKSIQLSQQPPENINPIELKDCLTSYFFFFNTVNSTHSLNACMCDTEE